MAIWRRMNARSWSATVEVETLSAVPHSTHITSSSMSGSEACGAAPVAKTSSSASATQPPHAVSSSSGCSVRSSQRLVDRPAALRGDPPAAVDHERLGEGARAVAVGVLAVAVAQARERLSLKRRTNCRAESETSW